MEMSRQKKERYLLSLRVLRSNPEAAEELDCFVVDVFAQ